MELEIIIVNDLKNSINNNFLKNIELLNYTEYLIFLELAKGYNNYKICLNLDLAPSTVKNYISNIYKKLKINKRIEIINLF